MIFDVRTYTCKPGMLNRHLALYKQMGLAPQSRHLGEPFAYMVGETGNVNQYMHIWPCGWTPSGWPMSPRAASWVRSRSRRAG